MYTHTTFNLNPRAVVDRHAAAQLRARQARRSHAPERDHRDRREQALRGADARKSSAAKWTTCRGCARASSSASRCRRSAQKNPKARAIMMGQHGFIKWADDDKECYTETLRLHREGRGSTSRRSTRRKAATRRRSAARNTRRSPQEKRDAKSSRAILPWLRGQVCAAEALHRHRAGRREDPALREFEGCAAPRRARHDLPRPFPAHEDQAALRAIGIPQTRTTLGDVCKKKLAAGLEQYRKDYAAYYEKCKHANSPAMRDPNPTVMLIPGLGMIAWGKDKSESRVTAEFYNCAVEVMRGAEAIDEYIALPQQEAFDIEYWLLEEAKLQRMPAEKELARQVVVVVGAGSGIGKETAHRLVKEGAHIVCVDLNAEAAEATAKEITDKLRPRHRRRRHRHFSGCGPAIGLACEHHRPRQRPRDARPGRARLRRVRSHRRDGRHLLCRATPPATSRTTNGRSRSAST